MSNHGSQTGFKADGRFIVRRIIPAGSRTFLPGAVIDRSVIDEWRLRHLFDLGSIIPVRDSVAAPARPM